MSPRRLEDVWKTCLEDVLQTFLQDIFKTCLQDVYNFSPSRRFQDVFNTSSKTSSRLLQDVLEDEKLLHWRRFEDVLKTCLEDVFKTSSRPTNVCWNVVLLTYIEKKCFLNRSVATILPLNPNCLKNFGISILLMEVSKCWKIVQFPKISIKMKKFQTFYELKTVSHLKKIILPHPPNN